MCVCSVYLCVFSGNCFTSYRIGNSSNKPEKKYFEFKLCTVNGVWCVVLSAYEIKSKGRNKQLNIAKSNPASNSQNDSIHVIKHETNADSIAYRSRVCHWWKMTEKVEWKMMGKEVPIWFYIQDGFLTNCCSSSKTFEYFI